MTGGHSARRFHAALGPRGHIAFRQLDSSHAVYHPHLPHDAVADAAHHQFAEPDAADRSDCLEDQHVASSRYSVAASRNPRAPRAERGCTQGACINPLATQRPHHRRQAIRLVLLRPACRRHISHEPQRRQPRRLGGCGLDFDTNPLHRVQRLSALSGGSACHQLVGGDDGCRHPCQQEADHVERYDGSYPPPAPMRPSAGGARVQNWRQLMREQVSSGRDVLRALLAEKVVMTPTFSPHGAGYYELRASLNYSGLFEGICPIAVASPGTATLNRLATWLRRIHELQACA